MRASVPLNTCENSRHIVSRTPSILEDIKAKLARSVDVGVKHLTDEFDGRWLIWVLFLKLHDQPKGSIFEGRVGGSDNDCVPRRAGKLRLRRRLRDHAVPGHDVVRNR